MIDEQACVLFGVSAGYVSCVGGTSSNFYSRIVPARTRLGFRSFLEIKKNTESSKKYGGGGGGGSSFARESGSLETLVPKFFFKPFKLVRFRSPMAAL